MPRLLTTLIVDDEPIARKVILEELEAFAEIDVIAEAGNGEQALKMIYELQPGLVFLDLQMPVMDGFDVLRNLPAESAPLVLIVTAYNEHAITAFEVGAIDYLLKPVGGPRLKKAIERVLSLLGRKEAMAERASKLAAVAGPPSYPTSRKIVARRGQEYILLELNEILAFQAEDERVWIVTAQDRYLATQPLREISLRLKSSPFERVHRNAIVNVNYIRKVSAIGSQRWLLTLSNSQEFVVSKRQGDNVRHLLQL